MSATRIAIVGVGKIARDQHLPAIEGNGAFTLAATVSRSGGLDGVENHATVGELLEARSDITALSLCVPPQVRYAMAVEALEAGRHVMLEKPPGATVAEVEALKALADRKGVVLFATWHSREADGVSAAKAALAERTPTSATITWREDVRHWHPGQEWIWEAGGLGVFDPGINALSILTEILPAPVHLTAAELEFPSNRDTPIAARLSFAGAGGLTCEADFDWRQEGPQTWEIAVETAKGPLRLQQGGATLEIDGAEVPVEGMGEYPGLYARFADLLADGRSDVDLSPLVHVADAFLLGKRIETEAFHDRKEAAE